jgi:hypothetical protein
VNRFDVRELAVQLYYSATGKHDVDDHQWNVLLDTYNKRYWREAAKSVGSLLQLDTPDLTANVAGGLDYSGSIYGSKNDIASPINFTDTRTWTVTNATVTSNAVTSPVGNEDATLLAPTATPGACTLASSVSPAYPGGTVDLYIKAATASANTFLYFTVGGLTCWYDVFNSTVKTNGITGSAATIVPAPYPGFPYQVGTTSSATPTTSPTGWYRATLILPTSMTSTNVTIGLSSADNSTATAAGVAAFIWGARKTYMGSPAFASATSNMIDPNGVHNIMAVEIKYLGRYIHLDYEIPQDRYVYNIAFGQIQVLIPNAFTLMGEQILLLPKTTGAQVLRVSYVPRMSDWTSDNANALNGFLPEWHHMLAYEVAGVMATVTDPKAGSLMLVRNELRQQWNEFVISRQRQEGRKIRFVPYE